MSAQDTAVPSSLNLPYKALCIVLSVAICFFGLIPRTNSVIDDYTQIEKAEAAIPLVAIPIAATLFSLAGVAVVGATQEQYNVNLEKCWNDFVSWSGSTSEALVSELQNAVGDDGKIILSMLTTSALPNILNWGKSLDAPVVETSAIPAGDTYVYGSTEVSLPMVDDVASMYGLVYGGVSTCYGYATFTKSNGEFLEYALWSNQKSPHLKYFLQSDKIAFENIMSPAPGSATGWGTQTMTTYSGLNASYFKSIKRDSIIDFYIDNTIVGTYNRGAFSGAGTYTPLVTAVDGAVAGSFAGSVIGGGTTLDQIAPTVNVWSPTADQLANGYAYTDVMEGTGALEGTQGGEGGGETGDTDTGSLLNKILAALTLLLGLDRIPAILDGISSALTGWWDALVVWCADVWSWMQSLDLAKWLSDVWGWLSSIDLVSLLSPLALLWDWLSSLGLVDWLAKVWDWIATLDLAGALAGILEAVTNFPHFAWDGLTSVLSAMFVPNDAHLQDLTSGLKDQVTDMFGIDFDLSVLVPSETEIKGQDATFNFGGYAFTATVFDPSALVQGIEEFRPYIRGFVAIMLIFFVTNQVYLLLGSAGVFGRRVVAGSDEG